MNLSEIILIAVGLAMDCFAVSLLGGSVMKKFDFSRAFKIAFFFGLFQGIMPVIGWLLGLTMKNLIQDIDHWIAFAILFIIGLKMITQSFKMKDEERSFSIDNWYVLIGLSIATSIDAMIVGLSFAFLQVAILKAAILIAAVTFIISIAGVYIGKKSHGFIGNKAEAIGGLVLIAIGFKVLLDHLTLI